MRIAITGANGYIGGLLLDKIPKQDNDITLILREGSKNKTQYPVIEYNGTLSSLKEKEFDVVFHLGAYYTTKDSAADREKLIKDNVIFSMNIFEAYPKAKIVCASTFSSREKNKTFYAVTKKQVEELAKGRGQDIVFITIPDTYGPNDKRPKITNFLYANKGEKFEFQKSKDFQISLIHVYDVVNSFLFAGFKLPKRTKSYIYDIIPPYITMEELANIILDDSVERTFGEKTEQQLIKNQRELPFNYMKHTNKESLKNPEVEYHE